MDLPGFGVPQGLSVLHHYLSAHRGNVDFGQGPVWWKLIAELPKSRSYLVVGQVIVGQADRGAKEHEILKIEAVGSGGRSQGGHESRPRVFTDLCNGEVEQFGDLPRGVHLTASSGAHGPNAIAP